MIILTSGKVNKAFGAQDKNSKFPFSIIKVKYNIGKKNNKAQKIKNKI